jgi:Ca-activated chloride channel homolog
VAEFGMLLRNSEFKGKATYQHCIQLAKQARGDDPHGYRAECVRLMETAAALGDVGEK